MSVELLLAIPILLMVVIGGVEITQMLMANQAIQAAANIGAREASMPGATEMSVRNAVRVSAAGWRFDSALTDGAIVIEVTSLGGGVIPLAVAETGDIVTVTVEVDAVDAVPDFLVSWGFSIADRSLNATALYRKE